MDSQVTVYRAPTSNLPRLSSLKHVAGLVGFISTVVGLLLALGIIHPLGGTEDAFAAAERTTAEAGSAKVAFEFQVPAALVFEPLSELGFQVPSDGQTLTVKGDGAYDFRTGRGKLTSHYPPELARLVGSPTDTAILDGDTTYTYRPDLSAWEMSDDAPVAGSQTKLDVFLELVPDDPSQIFEFLEAGGDVEKVGEESLLGPETTHYRATVDVHELVDHASADVQRSLGTAADGLQDGATLSVDVWIDQDGLLRRFAAKGLLAGMGDVTMRVDLYDFGTKVDVKVPPPSKVVDGALLGL